MELQPDKVLQDRFDQGQAVGELATTLFRGGVLIDLPHDAVEERLDQTREAIAARAPAVFEASFLEQNTFVAVDILERLARGFHLIEVKSSTSQKPEHIPDVAVQLHVLRKAGIDVKRASVMHLNRDFRHPDRGDRFCMTDVTSEAGEYERGVATELDGQMEVLPGRRSAPTHQQALQRKDPLRLPSTWLVGFIGSRKSRLHRSCPTQQGGR